jgi:hypothetical protein
MKRRDFSSLIDLIGILGPEEPASSGIEELRAELQRRRHLEGRSIRFEQPTSWERA